jgi:hypothetical protein
MLNLQKKESGFIIAHRIDVEFFDKAMYPKGNYLTLHRAVGEAIDFYSVRMQEQTYKGIFTHGVTSVKGLKDSGIPLSKVVVEKPAAWSHPHYVKPESLLSYCKQAHKDLNWLTGVAFEPFIGEEAVDETLAFTLKRDPDEAISAVNLDKVNFWWPPEKTVGDIGVPGHSPSNMYNHFIFGTWSCRYGAHDIAKLWSQASFFLGDKFGKKNGEIQRHLKELYEEKGKKILVRAFGKA